MELTAAEFICMSMFARLVDLAPAGLRSRPLPDVTFGGREDTQSCTRRETLGLLMRFDVFLDEGLEVMIMVGPSGRRDGGAFAFVGTGRECGGR